MQQKRYSSDLTERQWQRIAPLFVVQRTSKWPLQAIVNGIFYVLKNGCVWRDVPADLPPWVTVYYYFMNWSADGTWERVSGCLSLAARERAKKTLSLRQLSSTAKA
jgi:transposase